MESMKLCDEPAPLPFIRPKEGEEDGYKAAAKPQPACRVGKKVRLWNSSLVRYWVIEWIAFQTFEVYLNSWQLEFDDRSDHF